jgi:hypothetical protein
MGTHPQLGVVRAGLGLGLNAQEAGDESFFTRRSPGIMLDLIGQEIGSRLDGLCRIHDLDYRPELLECQRRATRSEHATSGLGGTLVLGSSPDYGI